MRNVREEEDVPVRNYLRVTKIPAMYQFDVFVSVVFLSQRSFRKWWKGEDVKVMVKEE